jgi:hypothetical protein
VTPTVQKGTTMPLLRLYIRAGVWARRRFGGTDRGDNPVPSAVIVVGFAIVAAVLVGLVLAAVNNIWEQVPGGGDLPDLPSD